MSLQQILLFLVKLYSLALDAPAPGDDSISPNLKRHQKGNFDESKIVHLCLQLHTSFYL